MIKNDLTQIIKTQQVYCSDAGVAAYLIKEKKNHAARYESLFKTVDNIDFTGLKVLDVGCGYGRDVAEFRKRGAEAYGVDLSAALLSHAEGDKKYYATHDLLSKEPIPFDDDFDFIWSVHVLLHVPYESFEHVIHKIWAKLRVGGILILFTKHGTGFKTQKNLGDDLERTMIFYTPAMFENVFSQLNAKIEYIKLFDREHGETQLVARVHKID